MTVTPDCGWCDAANALEHVWTEMGVEYYRCSCCTKLTRIGDDGLPRRVEPRKPVCDIGGHLMDGD